MGQVYLGVEKNQANLYSKVRIKVTLITFVFTVSCVGKIP